MVPSKHPVRAEGEAEDAPVEIDQYKVHTETEAAKEKWQKQILCEHLVYLRGVEIVYFEFKEILLDIALNKMKDLLDPKSTGKVKPVLTKFLDEHFLKRLSALIRFSHNQAMISQSQSTNSAAGPSNARMWPESEKDKIIKVKMEEKRRIEEEERAKKEEAERLKAEAAREMQEQREIAAKSHASEGGHGGHGGHGLNNEEQDTSKVHGGEHQNH